VCIVELGGVVGEIEGMPYIASFTENYRRRDYKHRLLVVHVTLLLDMKSSGEKKTKPAQIGIRKLRESGLVPDLLMCRSDEPMPSSIRDKITSFAQVEDEQVWLMGVHNRVHNKCCVFRLLMSTTCPTSTKYLCFCMNKECWSIFRLVLYTRQAV